jgi:hypothetical protein
MVNSPEWHNLTAAMTMGLQLRPTSPSTIDSVTMREY